ncbi:hypothetical protein [Haliscomenobacter hydrossis]|uniref:Uncharacterized protein n=1 Tax=Haliscomenobacter hydrossis (strain ATCC 27775 / DSM 1100 / LMG 10767 / O) TaxID=760192 RepID=F4KV17_HALH1|nr:hypothetical protein [Haliscomenobacter hydrossis]AEE49183.1 hypothetical protein Halhy_1288 [Haliscomenobacter hydrossis DSM 1100]
MPLREEFPEAGSDYMGGTCDGYEYQTIFAGSRLQASYDMVRQFLKEEGYGDVPLPKDAEELKLFRLPSRNKQLLMFEDNGYIHNPVKLLFPYDGRNKNTLILCVYNEKDAQHLLKFHRILERKAATQSR